MSFAVPTIDGHVEIVEKVGDVTHGSILTDAEGNKYVPAKYGHYVVPLEVALATMEKAEELVEEVKDQVEEVVEDVKDALGLGDDETPAADDGSSEDAVDSSELGEGTGEEG